MWQWTRGVTSSPYVDSTMRSKQLNLVAARFDPCWPKKFPNCRPIQGHLLQANRLLFVLRIGEGTAATMKSSYLILLTVVIAGCSTYSATVIKVTADAGVNDDGGVGGTTSTGGRSSTGGLAGATAAGGSTNSDGSSATGGTSSPEGTTSTGSAPPSGGAYAGGTSGEARQLVAFLQAVLRSLGDRLARSKEPRRVARQSVARVQPEEGCQPVAL